MYFIPTTISITDGNDKKHFKETVGESIVSGIPNLHLLLIGEFPFQ